MAAHSSALLLRKKLKSGLPSCWTPSLSISFAMAMTANRSALSSVTANRRIASCQARVFWRSIQLRKSSSSLKTPLRGGDSIPVRAGAAPAFGRAGDILVSDLGNRTRDLGLCAIAQLNDRQTGSRRDKAEQ